MVTMTVIKINAIAVPEGSGDEPARRFAARAGEVGSELWPYEVAGGRPHGTNP